MARTRKSRSEHVETVALAEAPEQLRFDILFDAIPDVTFRDQRDAMERPMVSLAKSPKIDQIEYTFPGDLFIKITPTPAYGWCTIWDYDIVIWLIGQLNYRFEHSKEPLPEVPAIDVEPHMLLKGIGRGTGGDDYRRLREAILRLKTTTIETNLWHGKRRKAMAFSFVSDFQEIDPGPTSSGGMHFLLPPWIVDSIRSRKGILAIHPAYFALSGGVERFIYRLARKMAGNQPDGARIGLASLHERSGSPMRAADFAKYVRKVVERNAIPEYDLRIYRNEKGEEILLITPIHLSKLPLACG